MTVQQRKNQLKKLIDAEKDPVVLEQVAKVLAKHPVRPVRQSALVKRALKADEDYKAGRYQAWEEVSTEMDALIDRLYAKPKKASKRVPSGTRRA
jgi:hypothetical protein